MVAIKGNQVEIIHSVGRSTKMKHIKHVKYILQADRYSKQLPSYDTFGRKLSLRLNPDKIQELQWKLVGSYHTTNIGLAISHSTHYIDINTLGYAKGDDHSLWHSISLQNNVTTVQVNTKSLVSSSITCTPCTA